MSGRRDWIEPRNPHRRVIALIALAGGILLIGFFCHPPEALGLATGHTHSGQPGVEHCWTSIAGSPTLRFIPILVALISFALTLEGRLLSESPFRPPRAFPPIHR